jgi:hypothetical protein
MEGPLYRLLISSRSAKGETIHHMYQNHDYFGDGSVHDMWRPLTIQTKDQDKMSKLSRGLSIDAYYQVSVHLAKGFQRRRLKCEKLTDDRRRTPTDGKSSHCLWQCELIILNWVFNIMLR